MSLPSNPDANDTMNPPAIPATPDLDGRKSPGIECESKIQAIL
jgi:hypothetical protein